MNKNIIRRKKVAIEHLPNTIPESIRQIYASRGVEFSQQLELKVGNLQGLNLQNSSNNNALKGLDDACQLLHNALINNTNIKYKITAHDLFFHCLILKAEYPSFTHLL